VQEETRYDPPLTERGVEQSRRAGEWLRAALAGYRHHHACTTAAAAVVYASPTSRTISTAVEVARALRGEVGGRCVTSLTLHHGLNCCAAAKHHGVGQVVTPHAAAEAHARVLATSR
jgi:broad specificity phosphatase PhoE